MNKIAICIVIALVLGAALAAAQPDTTRIVITPDSQTAKKDVIKAVQSNGGTFVRETLDNKLIFNIPSASFNNQISILTIPDVAFMEEDVQIQLPTPEIKVVSIPEVNIQMTPNDPLYPQQWGMSMIGANKMWDVLRGNSRVIVAVIDTGVDYNHEDLAAVNVALGYDFVNNDANAMDDNGHGTHVAGIIAATMNNGKGVAGVANVTVMPVKVCNKFGSCWTSDIADGIRWAADHGAKILSMSLSGSSPDSQTSDATRYAVSTKGALVIAASGNSGLEQPGYPAAYPWVISIGALGYNGNRASYSQYGSFLDLTAPGGSSDGISTHDIVSTYPNNQYVYMAGTSMATPHASGVAALYWSYNLSFTNKQVAYMLLGFADDLGTPGWDKYYGYGRVDAYPQDG